MAAFGGKQAGVSSWKISGTAGAGEPSRIENAYKKKKRRKRKSKKKKR